MNRICHGALEGGTSVFHAKWHNSICKSTPWSCESSFVLTLGVYLNTIVTKEAIHQGEDFMTET